MISLIVSMGEEFLLALLARNPGGLHISWAKGDISAEPTSL